MRRTRDLFLRVRLYFAAALALALAPPASGGPRPDITGGFPVFTDVALKAVPLQTSPVQPGTLGPKAGDGSAGLGLGALDTKTLGSVKGGQAIEVPVAITKEYAGATSFQVVLGFDSKKVSTTITGKLDGSSFAGGFGLPAQVKGDSVVYGAAFLGGSTTAKGQLAVLSFKTLSDYTGSTEITLLSVQVKAGAVVTNLVPKATVVLTSESLATGLAADFDGSGDVGFEDFFLFAAAFNLPATGDNQKFDLDKDASIGFGDFFLFAADFGKRK